MLNEFTTHFTTQKIPYIQIGSKIFLENNTLEPLLLNTSPSHYGLLLGEISNNKFIPAVGLLDLLEQYTTEKLFVNHYGELAFLYGKHIRTRHVQKILGSTTPGSLKLVQNEHDENLGYGMLARKNDPSKQVLRHIMDRGIFIKRDKNPNKLSSSK